MTQLDSGSLEQVLTKTARPYDMKILIQRAYTSLEEEWIPDLPPVVFNFQMPERPIMVVGDPDFLAMIVGEGLRNAMTFSPKGGQVDIELTHDDQYVFTVISDKGPGIPENDLPRVFNRFVQINRDKYEQQGMGLGLALARESARLHTGDCIIESIEGAGTRFTLRLPLSTG